jgi:hypothetical protein
MNKRQYHGKKGTKLYNLWKAIKQRCFYTKGANYKYYGGRGISMQKDWIGDFLNFETYVKSIDTYDLLKIEKGELSIDRIDSNKNYEAGNIKWSTKTMQVRNRRKMKNNTSGFVGVSYHKGHAKYGASIRLSNKQIHLGYKAEAKEAYQLRVDFILKNKLKGFEIEIPC